jgi:2,4-dienoyl-CoA reductase-like NADH-dependent reductase (Old Yellow Enzyme family)
VANYYQRRAEGEVGLILSEGTVINRPASSNDENIPHFHGEQSLKGWKKVIDKVHAAGGLMAPQIWHMGVMAPHHSGWMPSAPFEGPSGILNAQNPTGGVAMSEADIQTTIAAYAQSALDAKNLGFNAVELHGAHSYLIDQFFWDVTNKRTDNWGGPTIKERVRFGAEVVKAVRKAVGEDFPLIIRLSQWKSHDFNAKIAHTPQELEWWLQPLAEAGVDIFHCSQRRFWEPEFAGSDLNFAGWAKKITGKATITVGSIGLNGEFTKAFRGDGASPESLDKLVERFDRGEFDLVAVGRPLLSDPQWVRKIKEGREGELKGFNREDLARLT